MFPDYDGQTFEILDRVLRRNANCIDVGCNVGAILKRICRHAPDGEHHAFEPLPDLAKKLRRKFPRCSIHELALSDRSGESTFHHVTTNPGYSGMKRRRYDRPNEKVTEITVQTDRLDNIIPAGLAIDLIKIDVEGAEYQVLQGGLETIRRNRPMIVFEHGMGAADFYATTPAMIWELLHDDCGLAISTMKRWLTGEPPITRESMIGQFEDNSSWYFLAYSTR